MTRRTPPALAAALLLLTGCQAAPPAPPDASVKPGINAEFLKPGLKLQTWVERFENEGREVYAHREKIVAAARIRPGSSVADIGAGTGLFTPLLAKAAGAEGKVAAVDIAKDFLDHIGRRAAEAGLRNVRTVLCTDRSVELAEDSIDLAFICDTYHHFEHPRDTLASLHRALRPRGEIVLVEFKRTPGKSSEWILGHVRAGQEVFAAEIEAAGFRQIEALDLLKDNYFLRFRKIGP